MEELIDNDNAQGRSGIVLNEQNRTDLLATAKWAKFISIVGFVGVGLMVLGALSISSLPKRAFNGLPTGAITVVYLVAAVIYFFPILYLFKFSQKMNEAMKGSQQMSFNESVGFLKKHYTFIGVLTAIILSLYGLILVGAILTTALR